MVASPKRRYESRASKHTGNRKHKLTLTRRERASKQPNTLASKLVTTRAKTNAHTWGRLARSGGSQRGSSSSPREPRSARQHRRHSTQAMAASSTSPEMLQSDTRETPPDCPPHRLSRPSDPRGADEGRVRSFQNPATLSAETPDWPLAKGRASGLGCGDDGGAGEREELRSGGSARL